MEYLELLSSSSFSEFDTQDVDGWTAMHRAAAFGSSDDIAALLERGSSSTMTTRLGWTPIRCALRFKNAATFLELVRRLGQSFDVDEKDVRGWTLLDEAASMGNPEMLNLTLRHGANTHTLTKATSWMVPENLENQAVTPAGVAKSVGEDHHKAYIDALKKAGFDVTTRKDLTDNDSEDDMFWPAE
jgi:ankyrin repeat protein